MGASGNVFESQGQPSALENSRNLASSCRELRPDITGNTLEREREVRREPQNSSTPAPRFQSGSGILNHTGETYSHNGMTEHPRFPISENASWKFPDTMEFQSWKVNCKTEVCTRTADPQTTMLFARNSMGTSGNVFESPLAREGPSSALFENSRNLEASCCGLTS